MSLLRSALVRLPCVYFYLIHCQSHIKIQYSIQLKVWLDTHAKFGSLLCWWELAERINTTGLCLFLECFLPIKMFCCSAQIHISGSDKHRTDIKELTASKADCCLSSRILRVGQKAALEHSTCGQQARTFCASVKGNASLLKHKLLSSLSHIFWHLIFLIENPNMGEVIDILATGSKGFPFPFWSTTWTVRGICAIAQNASDKSRPVPHTD